MDLLRQGASVSHQQGGRSDHLGASVRQRLATHAAKQILPVRARPLPAFPFTELPINPFPIIALALLPLNRKLRFLSFTPFVLEGWM